jgi:transcriptional adapter 2-alpha
MQAVDKKRPKEEREVLHRLRPFARLQTAEDYEAFSADTLYEATLRKRIQELQHYRRLGLTNAADIEKYEIDIGKRLHAKSAAARDYYSNDRSRAFGRASSGPDARRGSVAASDDSRDVDPAKAASNWTARKPPPPLNLANSPSLHLLTPAEQTLCSTLRILPKPYLVIKETLVREYARRGGKLRRREARDLVKIDVNKTSRVWDFLVQAGFLKIGADMTMNPPVTTANGAVSSAQSSSAQGSGINGAPSSIMLVPNMVPSTSRAPSVIGSPVKEATPRPMGASPAPPGIHQPSSTPTPQFTMPPPP